MGVSRMGHKIFISYKYADSDVYKITENSKECTVREYVDKIESMMDSSDDIYKGESDGEDLSKLSEDTIWTKLKNRIYDSTLTIVMISKNMQVSWKQDKDQWIPREISYSLKEISRVNKSGAPVTSKTNAVLAVVVPDSNNSYAYYTYKNNCCDTKCRTLKTYTLFNILKNNMFNIKEDDKNDCSNGTTIWHGDSSYITSVEWDDFIQDINKHIDKAYELQDNMDKYDIYKEA